MENKTEDEIDDLLLERKNFWTGIMCVIHEWFNDNRGWKKARKAKNQFNIID